MTLTALWLAGAAGASALQTCPSEPATLERWRAVRDQPESGNPDMLAVELAECLRSADPELRDRIAFEVLTYWLRNERLTAETLAELVRADAQSARWDEPVLQALLNDALAMMAAERDFRGLDARRGWIHAVFGEFDRLARVVVAVADRGLLEKQRPRARAASAGRGSRPRGAAVTRAPA